MVIVKKSAEIFSDSDRHGSSEQLSNNDNGDKVAVDEGKKEMKQSNEVVNQNKRKHMELHNERQLQTINVDCVVNHLKSIPSSSKNDSNNYGFNTIETNLDGLNLNHDDDDVQLVENGDNLAVVKEMYEGDKKINESNISNDMPDQIITLNLNQIKNDYSEFEDFVRLYFYVSNVSFIKSTFEKNSMDLFFRSTDEKFNQAINPNKLEKVIFGISLTFSHDVVPEKCYYSIKSRSIEINLHKLHRITWGSLSIKPNISDINYLPNKWIPCAIENSTKKDEEQQVECIVDNDSKLSINGDDNNNNHEITSINVSSEKIATIGSVKGKLYGFTGLENLGNTCFMNSVLQCLSNTDPLRDYFLSNKYVYDINKMNKLGSGGDIVQEFAKFLQQLWTGKHLSISPARIKSLVGEKITSMFMGYNQHDAQEFMSYFLDSIHEDLNQNNNRPKIDYSKKENDKNEEDDLFSDEDFINETKRKHMESLLKAKSEDMWKQYKLFNSSIVIDLFCGQFKSILRCHDCTKKSIMFDPFLYVPLPIPPSKTTYEVTFFSRDSSTGMCTNSTIYSVALSYRATVGDLVNIVSNRANISPKLVRIIQPLDNHLFPKYPNPNWLLADYGTTAKESNNNRQLLLFEVFDDEQEDYIEIYIMQRSLSLLSIGQSINSRIGLPFIISLKRSMLTYSHLCLVLCSYASHSISANQVVSIDGVHNNIYNADLQNNNNSNNNNNNHEHDPSFIEPSHKMLRFNTDMFSPINIPSLIDGFKDRFDGLSPAPHLIYHKSTSAKAQDILVPFILRKPNLNEQCVSSIEEEIVPPLIPELDTSDIDSEESYSTLVNSSNGEENDNEEISDNVQVISQEDSSNKSPPEMAKSELPIMAPIEEQMERLPQASLEFDNDAVLDIGTTYSLAIDWIDVSNFSRTMVKLSTKTVRSSVIDLTRNGEADISLDDCFQLFNEPEVLGSQNCWRCPSCKELREATKQLSFWRLPPILVIQLKRFKMRGIIYRDKITKLVSYPIDGLDLSKYTYNCVETDHGRVKPIYDLYAVVNHVGGPFLGHFTSFARSFNGDLGWREFDDTSVEKIEKSSVVTDHAYLLFYKLRDWSG